MSYAGLGQVQSNLAALADCLAGGGSWDGSRCTWPSWPQGSAPPSTMDMALLCGHSGGVWDAPTNKCLKPLESYIRKCQRSGGQLDSTTSWHCQLPDGSVIPRPDTASISALETAMKAQKAGGGKWECLAKQGAWDGSQCLLPPGTPATVVSGLTQQGTPAKIVDAATYAAAKRSKVNPLVLAAAGAVVLLGGAWWWSSRP